MGLVLLTYCYAAAAFAVTPAWMAPVPSVSCLAAAAAPAADFHHNPASIPPSGFLAAQGFLVRALELYLVVSRATCFRPMTAAVAWSAALGQAQSLYRTARLHKTGLGTLRIQASTNAHGCKGAKSPVSWLELASKTTKEEALLSSVGRFPVSKLYPARL